MTQHEAIISKGEVLLLLWFNNTQLGHWRPSAGLNNESLSGVSNILSPVKVDTLLLIYSTVPNFSLPQLEFNMLPKQLKNL